MELNKIIVVVASFLIVSLAFLFLFNFDVFAHNVFMVINRLGVKDAPYYNLLFALLLFIVLTYSMLWTKNQAYFLMWLVKAFVTLIVMIPYEMYYGLDAYMYYAEAVAYSGHYVGGKGGTTNVVELNHLFTYFVGDSYYSLKLLNSFIAFLGIIFLHKSYEIVMKRSGFSLDNDKFVYVLFLFPSILFWSSILGKDPLNLFFVGLFIYGFIRFMTKKRFYALLLVAVAIIAVRYIRTWWAVIMILSIVMYYINLRSLKRNNILIPFLPGFIVVFI